jgi:DNA-binding MarR family transcriptional regulator
VIRIELTNEGRGVVEQCDRAVDAVEREMLAELGADEAADLRESLVRCGRALAQEPARSAAG